MSLQEQEELLEQIELLKQCAKVLTHELTSLRAENDRLRAELAKAGVETRP